MKTYNKNAVFAFDVTVAGMPFAERMNARTSGKAKYDYWREVRDAWPDVPFTAMRARKAGPPRTSAAFERNAAYRGMPGVKCGDRVTVGKARGVIVGHNASANFDVLFDDDSPEYTGQRLNCHPDSVTLETPNAENACNDLKYVRR